MKLMDAVIRGNQRRIAVSSSRVSTLSCALLAGCHVATMVHVPNLEVPRSANDTTLLEPAVRRVERPTERHVAIFAFHVDRHVQLVSALVRPVQGSECYVSSPPICLTGQCQVGISIEGDVCVLMVRGTSQLGHDLDSYCHDLSHPDLSDLTRVGNAKGHPVWERCIDRTQQLVREHGTRREVMLQETTEHLAAAIRPSR